MSIYYFNPLPRKEGDNEAQEQNKSNRYFNPLPRKEGDGRVPRLVRPNDYFNPLPRKEGDLDANNFCYWSIAISIHSLVKRETCQFIIVSNSAANFNPLPRKEGDLYDRDGRQTIWHFNPLPRKEGDVIAKRYCLTNEISIHSLVKSET